MLANSLTTTSSKIINLTIEANRAEAKWLLETYQPNFFATLGFKHKCGEARGQRLLRKHMQAIAHTIKSHLFWVAYYDDQPLRGLDGEDCIHFHLFVEYEARKGVNFSPRGTKLLLSRLNVLGVLLGGRNWRHGTTDVREYEPDMSGVEYSRLKHEGAMIEISCPEMRSCWNRFEKHNDCLYSRNPHWFFNHSLAM